MTNKIYDYDPAASLDSQEAIATFMTDAFETGDAVYIAKALGVVARAKDADFFRSPAHKRDELKISKMLRKQLICQRKF